MSEIKLNDKVIANGKFGIVRYIGELHVKFYLILQFATGIWVGVELDEPLGKHDGSYDGKRVKILFIFIVFYL